MLVVLHQSLIEWRRFCAFLVFLSFSLVCLALPTSFLQAQADEGKELKNKQERVQNYNVTEWEKRRQKKNAEYLIQDGEIRFRYASMLFVANHYKHAQELLEEFMILFPNHPRQTEVGNYLARIAEKQGRFEDAMRQYIQIYHQEATSEIALNAYFAAGRLAVNMGQVEQARLIFETIRNLPYAPDVAKLAQIELEALKFEGTK